MTYITNSNEIFNKAIIDDAIKHAQSEFPYESCGAVIDNEYVAFENLSENKEESFLINSPGFDAAYKSGSVGSVIHSHNNYPMASVADQDQQKAFDIPFGIINLRGGSVLHVVFWGNNIPTEKLYGRNFFWGVWDCYALVRDFIKSEFKTIGPNPSREYAFWDKGESLFEQFTKGNMPFKMVDKSHAMPNDILLYNMHGTPYLNHIAIYKENGLALHHFQDQVSRDYPIAYKGEFLKHVIRFDSDMDINIDDWELLDD